MANTNNTITRLLSPASAAKYLAVCERTLFGLTKSGKLPAVRIGRAVRYDVADLDAFITKAKTGNQPESIGQILPAVMADIDQRRTAVQQENTDAD